MVGHWQSDSAGKSIVQDANSFDNWCKVSAHFGRILFCGDDMDSKLSCCEIESFVSTTTTRPLQRDEDFASPNAPTDTILALLTEKNEKAIRL